MPDYRGKLDRTNATNKLASRISRDIAGDYPPPGNLPRRGECERNFRWFCERYFPAAFNLPWSPDHLKAIGKIERCVLDGGLFALAMPRGQGKSTLCTRAAIWALLYGHRRFVSLIAATEKKATELLDQIRTELSYNALLAEDFRQVTHAIRRLENNARRCAGQLYMGEQTLIEWGATQITFPTMPDDACDGTNVSGSTVTVAGITGSIRGQSHTLRNGTVLRPELVLIDDPQDRESAKSPTQVDDRMAIIRGDILAMAGPGKTIAALAPVTVIRSDDLADQLLNREKNPQWRGERTKAVYSWPTNTALWEKYHEIRAANLQRDGEGGDPRAATEFYRANRAAMDEGAVVAWPERFGTNELSAIQHCQNLLADLKDAFWAEHQNEPLRDEDESRPTVTADDVARKLNGVLRGVVPSEAVYVTAFIDVHDALLFWCVTAWGPDFTGHVVDYGVHPEQGTRQFTLRTAPRTLGRAAPGAGREAAILAGLEALSARLLAREYEREGGGEVRIERCLVDAGYVPEVIYNFCRRSVHAGILLASRGAGIGATSKPMSEYSRKPGERFGWNWLVSRTATKSALYCRFDANFWKSFIQDRLAVARGDPGSLSLYGHDAERHRLFAEHVSAEVPTRVTANGRTVDEWRPKVGGGENHWLDCLVGTAVAASMCGAELPGIVVGPSRRRRAVSFSQMQQAARQRRAI